MSQTHLSIGSTNPPTKPGLLRLYSMQFCPFAQRARLILDAKKIPYEVVNINLSQKPEWLVEKSPLGKVPALELNGDVIYESLIIADYLDEQYLETPLYPKDPMQKAKDKLVIEQFGQVISNMVGMFLDPNKLNKDHMDAMLTNLDYFEKELVKRKSPYFSGSKPGMVDLMIWPWCERSGLLKLLGGDQFILPAKQFVRLMEWAKEMQEDDTVKVSYLPLEAHLKYLQGRLSGSPDYNFLVKTN